MKYLVNSSVDPHRNMAFDEYALESIEADEPLFYLWQNAPAVIIGLNQSPYAEVNLPYLEEHGIALARRVTGGGAVYHDLGNLNYSIVGPLRQMEDAFELVPAALRTLGADVERTGRNDIFISGRKCSGYAKRLSKNRMMIHGTLMWNVDIEVLTKALQAPGSKISAAGIASVRSRVANLSEFLPQFDCIDAFRGALHDVLAGGDSEYALTTGADDAIGRLASGKFATWGWIYGRSPATEHASTAKFPCGTVTAHYTLRHGVFTALRFTGDFIGSLPADELAAALIGHSPAELPSFPVSGYFDGTSASLLATLFA